MKKMMMGLAALFAGLVVLADTPAVDAGFWFDCPKSITNANVDGVRFGLPVSAGKGKVEGAELALLLAATRNVEGLQFSLIGANLGENIEGVQWGFLNVVSNNLKGLQLGMYNYTEKSGYQLGFINFSPGDAKFQFGFVNFNQNGWLPVMILVNFGSKTFK